MEFLKILLLTYFIIGLFNLIFTIIVVFRPRTENGHLAKLKEKWSFIWNTPGVGKILAFITILLSIFWLIAGWPYGIRKGFENLKNRKNEI
jgi:preprotein translocase subunit SecG